MVIAGIPTRGLINSYTIDGVLRNKPTDIIFSHGLPVPEAYNHLVDQFLETDATHLWIVDDDMDIPHTTLRGLLEANVDIALCDYPLETGWSVQREGDEFLFGGLGCVLVRRVVFEWGIRFRTDRGYSLPDMKPIKRNPDKHGGQDVDFYVQAKEDGFSIEVVGYCGHLRIKGLHPKGNKTQYEVEKL